MRWIMKTEQGPFPVIGSLLMIAAVILFILFLLIGPVRADEPKPESTVAQLQAEVESLKLQLAKLQATSAFEMRVCQGSAQGAVQAAREFVTGAQQPTQPQVARPKLTPAK